MEKIKIKIHRLADQYRDTASASRAAREQSAVASLPRTHRL